MTGINIQNTANEDISSRGNTSSSPDPGMENNNLNSEFRERYGRGFQLTPKISDIPMSSTGLAECGK